MLEQKQNNEKNADAALGQPAYCKTDVTGCISSPKTKDGLKEKDFLSYGYVLSGKQNDTMLFEKKDKPGWSLHLMYNVAEQTIRLRYDRAAGFYSVLIARMKVLNREELDWVFSRISHDAL
jgi:hypothetical protein